MRGAGVDAAPGAGVGVVLVGGEDDREAQDLGAGVAGLPDEPGQGAVGAVAPTGETSNDIDSYRTMNAVCAVRKR